MLLKSGMFGSSENWASQYIRCKLMWVIVVSTFSSFNILTLFCIRYLNHYCVTIVNMSLITFDTKVCQGFILKSHTSRVLTIYLPPTHTRVIGELMSFWRIAITGRVIRPSLARYRMVTVLFSIYVHFTIWKVSSF